MTDAPSLPQRIIQDKRDGAALSNAQIQDFVAGLTSGRWSEGQIAALAMAIFFRGMSVDERASLTRTMAASGRIIDWRKIGISGPILDKHSTGGIGDKVSLILAPLVAACGGIVPMIAGRGLGHTGGTVDKLESIPGYRTAPDLGVIADALRQAGCAVIGQTDDVAPADRRLYAVRDITATVESIPLITASILAKKLAAGLDGLVMDIKFGSGAFLPEIERADELGQSIVSVAEAAGLTCRMYLTDMNEALGRSAGNSLEVREALDLLSGRHRDHRLAGVTLTLASEMLVIGGLADDLYAARMQLEAALSSGAGLERFLRMVTALGGPPDLLERLDAYLPAAPVIRPVYPDEPGFIGRMDLRAIGWAIVSLGGGRARVEDRIDPAVGLSEMAGIGEWVDQERPICLVHARSETAADACATAVRAAISLTEDQPPERPLIAARR